VSTKRDVPYIEIIHTYAHKKLIKAAVEDIDGFDKNFTRTVTMASYLPVLQLLFD
jgi:hypothetical protein